MAKFYVGQRVRLVRPVYQENLNRTGSIGRFFEELLALDGPVNCCVNWDDGRVDGVFYENGLLTMTHTSQLEPIVDDGHKKIEWSECIFDREGRYIGEPVHG